MLIHSVIYSTVFREPPIMYCGLLSSRLRKYIIPFHFTNEKNKMQATKKWNKNVFINREGERQRQETRRKERRGRREKERECRLNVKHIFNSMGLWGAKGDLIVVQSMIHSLNRTLCAQSVMSDSFATPWTVALPDSSIHGMLRQEHWSRKPFLLQGIFPTQRSNP